MFALIEKYLTGLEYSEYSACTRSDPSAHYYDGCKVMLAHNMTLAPKVLDGRLADSSVASVSFDHVPSWMTGVEWRMRALPTGAWAFLQRDDQRYGLARKGNTLVLKPSANGQSIYDEGTDLDIERSMQWRIYALPDDHRMLMKNEDGGWVATNRGEAYLERKLSRHATYNRLDIQLLM